MSVTPRHLVEAHAGDARNRIQTRVDQSDDPAELSIALEISRRQVEALIRQNDELLGMRSLLAQRLSSLQLALAKAHRFAHYDELTGLPNRRLLLDRFIQAAALAKRHRQILALLFFDVNDFKGVNDQLGHAAGDKFLQLMGARLSNAIRVSDTACRYGGDEFVVLLTELDRHEHAVKVLQKIRAELAQTYVIDRYSIRMFVSDGMAIYPNDAQSFTDLVRLSDRQMFSNKSDSRIRSGGASKLDFWLHDAGKEIYDEKLKMKILGAQLITKKEYKALRRSSEFEKPSADEENAMRRYEIESFYFEDATEALLEADKDGKYRRQVRQYEQYTRPDADLQREDVLESWQSTDKTHKKTLLPRKQFLHQLFTSAGLADPANDLKTDVVIASDSLAEFADFCDQRKDTIARWFDIDIRKNIHDKPAQQLGSFLRLVGVSWERLKPVKRDGEKIYRYQIPQSAIDELNAIVSRRLDESVAKRWHESRNATQENRLIEPEPESDPETDAILESIRLEKVRKARERLLEELEKEENRLLSLDDVSDPEADDIRETIRELRSCLATEEHHFQPAPLDQFVRKAFAGTMTTTQVSSAFRNPMSHCHPDP